MALVLQMKLRPQAFAEDQVGFGSNQRIAPLPLGVGAEAHRAQSDDQARGRLQRLKHGLCNACGGGAQILSAMLDCAGLE